jgi:hypothetical protein
VKWCGKFGTNWDSKPKVPAGIALQNEKPGALYWETDVFAYVKT